MRKQRNAPPEQVSTRKRLPALLLCFFFGIFGTHRFYVGKVGTGILQMLTLGGFFLWVLVDMIIIVVGQFSDVEGAKLKHWT